MKGLRPQLDPIIHAPVRLQIAAVLASVSGAEFATLREITCVSDSLISKHLKALEEAATSICRRPLPRATFGRVSH